jgi:hypothetical protein
MQLSISKNIEELSQKVAEWMVDYIHKTLQLQDFLPLLIRWQHPKN